MTGQTRDQAVDPAFDPVRDAADKHDVPAELVTRLRARVSDRLTVGGADLPDDERDMLIASHIAEELVQLAQADITAGKPPLPARTEAALARAVRDSFTGLGGLEQWITKEGVEDVHAMGYDNVFIRTTDGRTLRVPPIAASDEALIELIRVAAARSGAEERRFDRGSPALSLQLPGGQRLFAVMAVSKRPSVSIRRNSLHRVTLDDLVVRGELTLPMRELLTAMVRARKNIVVCGGVGRGKTTLLRACAAVIPPHERIVTVEDAYERPGRGRRGAPEHGGVAAARAEP
jgi:Flp pilus assembly CpaF family ATPase